MSQDEVKKARRREQLREAQRRRREKKSGAGLVRVEVWTKPENVDRLKNYVSKLNKD